MKNRANLILILLLMSFSCSQAGLFTVKSKIVPLSYDYTLLGTFGIPSIVGNNLFFTPAIISANNAGFAGIDLKHSTLNVKAKALNGGTINTINISEKGGLVNKGNSTSVEPGVHLRVTDSYSPLSEAMDAITSSKPLAQQSHFLPTKNGQSTVGNDVSLFVGSSFNVIIKNILIAKKSVVLALASIPMTAIIWLFVTFLFSFLAYSKRFHYI
jgi:hypothetical protein